MSSDSTNKEKYYYKIGELEKITFSNYNIVTGSAFLDILPKNWFYKLYLLFAKYLFSG